MRLIHGYNTRSLLRLVLGYCTVWHMNYERGLAPHTLYWRMHDSRAYTPWEKKERSKTAKETRDKKRACIKNEMKWIRAGHIYAQRDFVQKFILMVENNFLFLQSSVQEISHGAQTFVLFYAVTLSLFRPSSLYCEEDGQLYAHFRTAIVFSSSERIRPINCHSGHPTSRCTWRETGTRF